MSDTQNKMLELAKRLLERTQSGSLSWIGGPQEEQFEANLPRASVRIDAKIGNEYVLSVFNETGTLVDDLRSQSGLFVGKDGKYRVLQDDESVLSELYELARRKALKADETIDALLEDLAG